MKALTLTQPWATLVAIGAKSIETRSWFTSYRELAIHAAKGWTRADRELCGQQPFFGPLIDQYPTLPAWDLAAALPRGAVIAIAFLSDCRIIRPGHYPGITDQELAFGDYTPGRYRWYLTGVTPLNMPLPAKGSLGLWEWEVHL